MKQTRFRETNQIYFNKWAGKTRIIEKSKVELILTETSRKQAYFCVKQNGKP